LDFLGEGLMKKKIVFGLAMLLAITASLSAQEAFVNNFSYVDNFSEQQFILLTEMSKIKSAELGLLPANKLPNAVIQAINNNLRSYSLDIGDYFAAGVYYQGFGYSIGLRITDARNFKWQFFAYRIML